MNKSAMIRRVSTPLKDEVENVFEQLGLSATQAITLFYQQVRLNRGLPFDVRIPNAVTQRTFAETDRAKTSSVARTPRTCSPAWGSDAHTELYHPIRARPAADPTARQRHRELKAILTTLINEEPLPERQRDHPLVGNYKIGANATSSLIGCSSTSW